MGESKKKCCGKFKKKGKHCGGCPLFGDKELCKPEKSYCKDCPANGKKKGKKNKKKKKKKGEKK